MNERTVQILESVIKEFIETGEPVSSRELTKKYGFGVKDATVRNELNLLMQEGYLDQPHISSGRVPTDRAYRFWVDELLQEVFSTAEKEITAIIDAIQAALIARDFKDCVHDVSEELGMLGVGYVASGNILYKSGLDALFHDFVHDSGGDPGEMYQLVEDFELLDERIAELVGFMDKGNQPVVFIGKSPITKSKQLSVVADRYQIGGEEFVLAAVGPKRMDYGRTIGFFRKLREEIGQ